MKEKITSVLMLTLILISTLSMAFIIRPSLAKSGENSILGMDFQEKKGETAFPNEANKLDQAEGFDSNWYNIFERKPDAEQDKNLERHNQTSRNSGDSWDFNNTSGWSSFAYVDGNKTRLIVGVNMEKPTSLLELEKIAAKHEAEIVNTILIGGEVRTVVVELSLASVTAFVEEISVAGLASYVEPNMKVQAQFVPDDPYWSLQWGPQKIEADWAWNTTVGSYDVLVAVVDTGIDYTHPDLEANYAPLGYDWVNMDDDPIDDFGHGTHCAGIIAAVLNNSVGIAGLAQVRVIAEKVLDSWGWGYWDWVASGIIHAVDQGADIISMSLGGYYDSELVHEAVRYAYDAGVLVIAAAGNEATSIKLYPAGYDEVIAVAATDQYDNTAWWSNYGEWIELAAPGVSIYSTMPTYHVTLNDWGYPMDYDYLSGTSMACPHVAGVAALVWSMFPNKTRDWVRLWLRYTADDLGDEGFDIYYGYGRINARKAVEQTPPPHELIAYEWGTPPYLEPGALGMINATILNFGENNETDVTVQLFANGTLVNSASIDFLAGGNLTTVSLLWYPTVEGLYNVTLYVMPVPGETSLENNVLWKYIYVGFPVKAFVLHSAGNILGDIITNWQVLNSEWHLFGDTMIYIDYTALNEEDITYEDIAATEADVLIISCAFDPYSGWEFTDSEIEAIEQYVHEGHGLIATAGTLYYWVPNNNKLAPLFGLNEATMWDATWTDLLHLVDTTHPIFTNVPNPLVFRQVGTAIPFDWRWDSNELVGGEYLALGHYQESAIVTYRGLVYISPWLEVIPAYYRHHLQLLYNAITWSRYQRPEHELVTSIEAPTRLKPGESTLLNATVSNKGQNNETHIELQLLIDGMIVDSITIQELLVDCSCTLSYSWTPTVQGAYNVTAYAPPVAGEDFTENNVATKMVMVLLIVVEKVLVYTDDAYITPSSRYPIVALNNLGINYTHYADNPWEFGAALVSQPWDLVIVDHCNLYALGNFWTELEAYVVNGGFLILSTFDIDGSHSEPTTLWDTLGVQWFSDMPYPEPVYRWVPTHPIFTFPNTVGDLTSYMEGYWDDGDYVRTTTGTAVAGFTISPTEGHTGIVVGNEYQTVLFTFLLCEFRYDQDADEKLDAVELWENAIVYVGKPLEHDLAVTLNAPKFLKPGESSLLNATVTNRGANNETDVGIYLSINGIVVNSTSISTLLTGASHTIDYLWTPTIEGTYNITAYAPPVENETILANNIATKFVTVTQPLIHPIEGQYANYTICYVDPSTSEEIFGGLWNFTYLHYVSPYQINVTMWMRDPYNYTQSGWMIVNIFTRIVERDSGIYWAGMWYPGWIETDVTLGSTINLLWGNATIVDNEVVYIDGRPIDCWEIRLEYYGYVYTFWYDKASGLWIGMRVAGPYQVAYSMLTATNIPIGFTYEHELTVTLDAPSMLPIDESTILNATVYNTGLSNETDVTLQLIINGAMVDDVTIGELLVGECYTISYPWTPTYTGLYNVTAYAQPVPGEEYVANNIVTKGVGVFFYTRLYLPHEWVGGGVPMGWHADDASWPYTLPFDFPFYGIYYRTIYISSNGLITFTSPDPSCANSIPALAQKLAIAPAWDDWVTYEPYNIYIWENSTHVGIRWYVRAFGSRTVANFEAVLSAEGVVQFNYEYNDGYVSATVGISNGVGHILAEDLTDLNYINTIVFVPFRVEHDVAIISVEPSANEVKAGDTVDIDVVVENQGNFTENFTVTAYASLQGNSTAATHASSLNSTRVYLDPSDYIFSTATVSVGYRFNVTVRVEDVTDLWCWQIKLYFSPSMLACVNASIPPDSSFSFPVQPTPWIDNVTGYVMLGASQIGTEPGVSGSGKLCILEFEITAVPPEGEMYSCPLNINNDGTYLLDPELEEIPATLEDGYYELISVGPPGRYVIGTVTITDMAPGERIALTFTWNTTDVLLGDYEIYAEASVVPGETDTEDNVCYDGIITVLPAEVFVHDIAVTALKLSSNEVYEGWIVGINVTIVNFGNATETFTATVYYNDTVTSSVTIHDFEPNATLTLSFDWNTAGVPYHCSYIIKAVVSLLPDEIDTTNNELTDIVRVKMLGDVDDNGVVEMRDIGIICEAFGANFEHPRWNSACDMNNDGLIDLRDIGLACKNYLKRC